MYQEQISVDKGFLWLGEVSHDKIAYLKKYVLPRQVLDIGCGSGGYTRFLSKQGFRVTPIDMIARMSDGYSFGFTRANSITLPFRDQTFDTVVMFDVLEHIADEAMALSEIARVTKKRLILSVPSDNDSFLVRYGLSLVHRIDKTHVREYSKKTLTKKLDEFGFCVKDIYFYKNAGMPLVVREFFKPLIIKKIVSLLMQICIKVGLANNEIAGDIFCVADRC